MSSYENYINSVKASQLCIYKAKTIKRGSYNHNIMPWFDRTLSIQDAMVKSY